jgi:hypothetical protein
MAADQQLAYESRTRPRQAAVAAAAGILIVLASVLQLVGPHTNISELTLELIYANKRFGLDVIAAVINALGSVALAWTLVYLFGVIRARNPRLAPVLRIVAGIGGVVAGLAGLVYAIVIGQLAHEFATSGAQTYQQANHLTSGAAIVTLQLVAQIGALLLTVGLVMISLSAMRVGLLTRFMGYLGVLAGVLFLLQITQVPVVQGYWLLALGYLLSGRWPTGEPPAWRSGLAEPWPSSQEMRERRIRAAGGTPRGRGGAGRARKPAPQAAGVAPVPTTTRSSPGSKRKRKRRK